MKKLLFLLAAVGMIFTACQSGGDVEEDNGGTPFVPEITISPDELSFPVEGGKQEVAITANFEYKVSEKADWLSVKQTETGLLVTAKESKNTSERSAYISIINEKYSITKTIDIVQEAWVPKIELAQQSVEVEFEPAEYEVAVTSPYSWVATTKNDWIVIESETGITGEEVLRFSTKRNEEEKERKGTITLKNRDYNLVAELYITQKAFVPDELIIKPESLAFAVEGGKQEIAITANFEYEYSTNADWLTIKKSEKGISVTVPNYVEVDKRTAKITISNEKYGVSKVVNVTQGAFVPAITIKPGSLAFAVEGGTQEVAITANFEYEVSANAGWLTIEKSEGGVKVTAQTNVEDKERTAEITISNEKYGISKVVKATQKAFVPAITIEPETLTFTSGGGTQEITITANFKYAYSANADWLTIEKSKSAIKVTAKVNTNFEERTAEITISSEKYGVSKTIAVTQKGVSAESKNAIIYTSSNGKIVTPYLSYVFGANIVSNTYSNGQGIIIFDAPVTRIGSAAFNLCRSLTSVTIPDSVTEIGERAFIECTSLTSVTIPDSVTSIGDYAFSGCRSLTSVTIPDSVTSIGESAFYKCSSLTSVIIPDSVTSIGERAFEYCDSLADTYVNITDLVAYAKSNLMHNIGGNKHLLVNGTEITELVIPDSVTSIGDDAFRNCTSLTSVTIGNSVTSIGICAFLGCTSLTSVTIPDSVTLIGGAAFKRCFSLTSVTIGNSVTSIREGAFRECTSLTSVTIGDSVTLIGNSAFSDCTSLTSVTIGNSVTNILEQAFQGCTSLTSVTIPDSVTSIGGAAFERCFSLTSVTIGDSVTSIGGSAFEDCTSLKEVYCKPTTPPSGGSNMFYNNASNRKIFVPSDSVGAYKKKLYWSEYASWIFPGSHFQ